MDSRQSYQPQQAFRPTPTYDTKLGLLNQNPVLPQKVDLNSIDPAYRQYYQSYNDSLDALTGQAANAKSQAQLAQGDIGNVYGTTTTAAENAYQNSLNNIGSANQDAQLSNRIRARALGGAPSSGFLDLANRTDIQSQKDVGMAGQQLGQAYGQADSIAGQAMSKIIEDLNNALLDIQNNGNLTLRQRDSAIAGAKLQAAQYAQYLAALNPRAGATTPTPTPEDTYTYDDGLNGGVAAQGAPVLNGVTNKQAIQGGLIRNPFLLNGGGNGLNYLNGGGNGLNYLNGNNNSELNFLN